MRAFKFGYWAFGTGLAVIGAGASVAALDDFKALGITAVILGGIGLFTGFLTLVFGAKSYFDEQENRHKTAEQREVVRDALLEKTVQNDTDRLAMEQRIAELQLKILVAQDAETTEQKAAASNLLDAERQELIAQREKQEQRRNLAEKDSDEPRLKIVETELEINLLRLAAVIKQMDDMSAAMPSKEQREAEALAVMNAAMPSKKQRTDEALAALNQKMRSF